MNITQSTLDELEDQGYNNLLDYFTCLAEDFGIEVHCVEDVAEVLGESELFDGLLTSLEDYYGKY